MATYHIPVMLTECIQGLDIVSSGTYVDVTFGGGGHSRAILDKIDATGRLYVFDQDKAAKDNLPNDDRVTFINANYRHLYKYLRLYSALPVDGIIADFGISSYQIDTAERGFSIRYDGRLDMRMNQDAALTAWDVVNTYSDKQLTDVLFKYGEVKNAKRLVAEIRNVIQSSGSIDTTQQLLDVISPFSKGEEMKYAAKVFQAIRIEVNDEINAIYEFLQQTTQVVKKGGRLVVMSYHSLEDRPVKNFIKFGICEGQPEKDIYGRFEHWWKAVNKKPIVADPQEVKNNPRSRSAKLRIAERL
ncbi:MAG: 16S rRNA (cytosine(1402)-N(4))-methyltransferase RsmH [Chitinophagales bacterium]|nr:16S rRNA (cytosine(1402)-N(4))-methyltransferase RsmH [Chitinophagales bacterium]